MSLENKKRIKKVSQLIPITAAVVDSLKSNSATDTATIRAINAGLANHSHVAEDITDLSIPTKTSELINDSGFLTEAPEITIDVELNEDSENPIQNKAVTVALNQLSDDIGDIEDDIGDIGTALDDILGVGTSKLLDEVLGE